MPMFTQPGLGRLGIDVVAGRFLHVVPMFQLTPQYPRGWPGACLPRCFWHCCSGRGNSLAVPDAGRTWPGPGLLLVAIYATTTLILHTEDGASLPIRP